MKNKFFPEFTASQWIQILAVITAMLLAIFLTGCKSTKDCDAYGFVEHDTIRLTTEHINFEGKCSPDTTLITYISDTVYITQP